MANTLSAYDAVVVAQEALSILYKNLGLAGRVFRGLDKAPKQKGSTIDVRIPSTFTAQAAPGAIASVTATKTTMVLNQWFETRFAVNSKDFNYTQEQFISDHIAPAAFAIADHIDQDIAALYKDVPWVTTLTTPTAVADITAARKIMRDNKVPLNDGRLHMMLDSQSEADLLSLQAFAQWQGAGDAGVNTQMSGSLGNKYGYEIFTNQNAPVHTSGVAADAIGALTAGAAAGATTISFNGVTAAGTFKKGDTFSLAGDTQRYALTADIAADGTGLVTGATFTPGLAVAHLTSDVITFDLRAGSQDIAFHETGFALAMAPLDDMAGELGAKVGIATDPASGLALRSILYWDGANSQVVIVLDALYGVKTIDGNRAVRLRR